MPKKKRFHFLVAVHLFLFRGNKVLLLRRFNTGYEDGKYSVPAGHVDGQESVKKAMVREAKEETGVEIETDDLDMVHVMHRDKKSEHEERIDFFFTARSWKGNAKNCEPDKCDQIKWFNQTRLPKSIIPYIKFALRNIKNGVVYSEFVED